jgi:hypothetical protein
LARAIVARADPASRAGADPTRLMRSTLDDSSGERVGEGISAAHPFTSGQARRRGIGAFEEGIQCTLRFQVDRSGLSPSR